MNLIIKYHFQNTKDPLTNHLILKNKKLSTVKDLTEFMLKKNLIQKNNYLRFKDYMDGIYCWVDIKNNLAPLPINNKKEVEIKILVLPYNLGKKNNEKKFVEKKKVKKDPFSGYEEIEEKNGKKENGGNLDFEMDTGFDLLNGDHGHEGFEHKKKNVNLGNFEKEDHFDLFNISQKKQKSTKIEFAKTEKINEDYDILNSEKHIPQLNTNKNKKKQKAHENFDLLNHSHSPKQKQKKPTTTISST